MWNTNNYLGPSGYKSHSGFARDFGYGHEEWNNNPNWIWHNFKVFNTEAKPKLLEFSKEGNLGILMIASFDKKQCAVGIATNVYLNDEEEMMLIAEELNIYKNYEQVWEQEIVKRRFKNDWHLFLSQWDKNYASIKWKCPIENYHWFEEPILLNPKAITGKEKLISMHGSYQAVLPQTILEIAYKQLEQKDSIIDWLTNGEFYTDGLSYKSTIVSNAKLRKKYCKKGSNVPTVNSYSYWVEGQRNVKPRHAKLQSKFITHLKELGIKFEENRNYIDVQYYENENLFFSEIKPTENIECKYSIRMAIGQLLEYRYYNNKNANIEIILSSRPNNNELDFVKSLNIRLTYFDEKTNTFKSE